jgi:hypothetical protein
MTGLERPRRLRPYQDTPYLCAPPRMQRLPRRLSLSRLNGTSPASAAIGLRLLYGALEAVSKPSLSIKQLVPRVRIHLAPPTMPVPIRGSNRGLSVRRELGILEPSLLRSLDPHLCSPRDLHCVSHQLLGGVFSPHGNVERAPGTRIWGQGSPRVGQ